MTRSIEFRAANRYNVSPNGGTVKEHFVILFTYADHSVTQLPISDKIKVNEVSRLHVLTIEDKPIKSVKVFWEEHIEGIEFYKFYTIYPEVPDNYKYLNLVWQIFTGNHIYESVTGSLDMAEYDVTTLTSSRTVTLTLDTTADGEYPHITCDISFLTNNFWHVEPGSDPRSDLLKTRFGVWKIVNNKTVLLPRGSSLEAAEINDCNVERVLRGDKGNKGHAFDTGREFRWTATIVSAT